MDTNIQEIRAEIRALKPEQTEDDGALCTTIRQMLQKQVALLRLRCKYLWVVPWRLATADTPTGACECVEQLERTPRDQLDPLCRRVYDTLLGQLRAVAAGTPCPFELWDLVRKIRKTPLDERWGRLSQIH